MHMCARPHCSPPTFGVRLSSRSSAPSHALSSLDALALVVGSRTSRRSSDSVRIGSVADRVEPNEAVVAGGGMVHMPQESHTHTFCARRPAACTRLIEGVHSFCVVVWSILTLRARPTREMVCTITADKRTRRAREDVIGYCLPARPVSPRSPPAPPRALRCGGINKQGDGAGDQVHAVVVGDVLCGKEERLIARSTLQLAAGRVGAGRGRGAGWVREGRREAGSTPCPLARGSRTSGARRASTEARRATCRRAA